MMERILPHPILSAVVASMWVFLVNDIGAGSVVLGLFLGWAIPSFTSRYWPERPRLKHPLKVIAYFAIVLRDIAVSNVQVAYWVLFRRGDSLKSHFVTVPLELTSAEAITALAGTITLTPGTLSADLSADGRSLLVHCLNAPEPEEVVAEIKARYERRLKEIFE